jgi:hypothetical protein
MRLLRIGTHEHRGAQEAFCVRGITRDAWLVMIDASGEAG